MTVDENSVWGATESGNNDSLRDVITNILAFSVLFLFVFILAGGREWPEGDAGEQYPMV